ncbi:MAG: type II toxin-antitoxin system ParD family antitoxin [Pirellulales bacterium]
MSSFLPDPPISLPSDLQEFVRSQVASGRYPDANAYVSDLVRADQLRAAERALEAMLLEGLRSGPMAPMTQADWESIRAEVSRRTGQPLTRDG